MAMCKVSAKVRLKDIAYTLWVASTTTVFFWSLGHLELETRIFH